MSLSMQIPRSLIDGSARAFYIRAVRAQRYIREEDSTQRDSSCRNYRNYFLLRLAKSIQKENKREAQSSERQLYVRIYEPTFAE